MSDLEMDRKKIKVCLVQLVQSPYWTERLRVLGARPELDVCLLLERERFEHRQGWEPQAIAGVRTEVLGSQVMVSRRAHSDLGYQINGVRAVPWSLSLCLLRIRPDVVVVCNATQVLFAWFARLILGFRLLLIVEDTPHAVRGHSRYKLWIKKLLYKRADGWFAFSDDAADFLRSQGIEKGVMRSCWSVDMATFEPTPDAILAKQQQRRITFVAALIEGKGIMQLIEAWAEISPEVRRLYRLEIIGSGILRQRVEEVLAARGLDDVDLAGQLPYAQVIQRLKTSCLFVLPTLQDLCSLTVLEAMACGCPVITTPYNGARDLINDGNGWVVDPCQPGALAGALTQAMSAPERLADMGVAARRDVLDRDNRIVLARFADDLHRIGSGQ